MWWQAWTTPEMIKEHEQEEWKCPLQKKYGDTICIDGQLWELTYNECAPPDQRQYAGECQWCKLRYLKIGERK